MAKQWDVKLEGNSANAIVDMILLRTCPEELRLEVVQECIAAKHRRPDPANEDEVHAAQYLASALRRRHVGDDSGEQLSLSDVAEWNAVLQLLPTDDQPSWEEDWVLVQTSEFYQLHGHLNLRRGKNIEDKAELALARGLHTLRRALYNDQKSEAGFLIRRQLVTADVTKWERAIPKNLLWESVREKTHYLPGCCVEALRYIWPRTPFLCKPCGCYLCGADFNSKPDLLQHWRDAHIQLPQEEKDLLQDLQIEEEMRKRIFFDEALEGPYEVRGQEHRRVVGACACHQTQSLPGSGEVGFQSPMTHAVPRHLSGCAVCARSFWIEDLHEMDLFAKPLQQPVSESPEHHPEGEPSDFPAHAARAKRGRFAVNPACLEKVNSLLSVREYARRWPKIPKHELLASSGPHPHKPGLRWLLHTRRIPEMSLNDEGLAPLVHVCRDCGVHLSQDDPKKLSMPKYALANDNWIGRLPFVMAPGGESLTEFEIKSLARGRMCVNKVIAEPEKRGPRDARQGGLRGNSIAFPQAKVELRKSQELPPPPEEAAEFLSKCMVIALAGADVEDLHNAKFAEIRRQPYVDAGHFLTNHDLFYEDMQVNETRAAEEFAESGRTSQAVLQQATRVLNVNEYVEHKLSGPADTGEAGVAHESITQVDGEAVESEEDDEEPHVNAGLPDEEFPADSLPTMHFCADELTSGDLDELQAIYKIRAEMQSMEEALRKEIEDDVVRALPKHRVRALQTAVRDFIGIVKPKGKYAPSQLEQCANEADDLEKHTSMGSSKPWEGYVQGTGSKPLSMYGPEQWAACFPHLFPYGDGIFGLARRQPLTFLQCVTMHLLREELSYQVSPVMLKEADTWFAADPSTDAAIDHEVVTGKTEQGGDAGPTCKCKQCSAA